MSKAPKESTYLNDAGFHGRIKESQAKLSEKLHAAQSSKESKL